MSAGEGLKVRLRAGIGQLALDVELDTAPGTLVVVGPNGAGKTSLLELVLGARPVERGKITIGNDVLFDTDTGVDVPLERRRIGYVPQDYGLFPHLDVGQNVEFALARAPGRSDRAARRERAAAILRDLGLESHVERRTQELSGGEKQRVALARALAGSPRALLLDEPLAALDVHSKKVLRAFLAGTLAKVGLPTLIVTHDPADARELGDRIAVLEAGTVTQLGTFDELLLSPASAFVAEFAELASPRRGASGG